MPKMVCVKCQREFKIEKNGIDAIEFTPIHTKEGKFLRLEPYCIWSSDKWKCPGCGVEVLAGIPTDPWAAEWMSWKVSVSPGVEKDMDFTGMLQAVINNPKRGHLNFTNFGREDQEAIQKMLSDGRIQVILNVEENDNGT